MTKDRIRAFLSKLLFFVLGLVVALFSLGRVLSHTYLVPYMKECLETRGKSQLVEYVQTGIEAIDMFQCCITPFFVAVFDGSTEMSYVAYYLLVNSCLGLMMYFAVESSRVGNVILGLLYPVILTIGNFIGISVAIPLFWIPTYCIFGSSTGNVSKKTVTFIFWTLIGFMLFTLTPLLTSEILHFIWIFQFSPLIFYVASFYNLIFGVAGRQDGLVAAKLYNCMKWTTFVIHWVNIGIILAEGKHQLVYELAVAMKISNSSAPVSVLFFEVASISATYFLIVGFAHSWFRSVRYLVLLPLLGPSAAFINEVSIEVVKEKLE